MNPTREAQLKKRAVDIANQYLKKKGRTVVIGVYDFLPRHHPDWFPGMDIFTGDEQEAIKAAQAIHQETGLKTNVRNPYNSALTYARFGY